MDWETLKATCLQCTMCPLCQTRHNVVFGVGPTDAEILFVGEGPGEQEDLTGEPFVGPICSAGPPPTVPSVRPSKNTSIFPFLRGTLPDASAMVTTAYGSPARCASSCACKSSSMRPPSAFFSSSYQPQRKIARDAALSNFALDKRAPCRYNKYAFERG